MADLRAAEARIRRVLAAKNIGAADYWRTRGRERFARELARCDPLRHECDGSGWRPRTSLPGRATVGLPFSAMISPETIVAT